MMRQAEDEILWVIHCRVNRVSWPSRASVGSLNGEWGRLKVLEMLVIWCTIVGLLLQNNQFTIRKVLCTISMRWQFFRNDGYNALPCWSGESSRFCSINPPTISKFTVKKEIAETVCRQNWEPKWRIFKNLKWEAYCHIWNNPKTKVLCTNIIEIVASAQFMYLNVWKIVEVVNP